MRLTPQEGSELKETILTVPFRVDVFGNNVESFR